jgi:hypothetical protein
METSPDTLLGAPDETYYHFTQKGKYLRGADYELYLSETNRGRLDSASCVCVKVGSNVWIDFEKYERVYSGNIAMICRRIGARLKRARGVELVMSHASLTCNVNADGPRLRQLVSEFCARGDDTPPTRSVAITFEGLFLPHGSYPDKYPCYGCGTRYKSPDSRAVCKNIDVRRALLDVIAADHPTAVVRLDASAVRLSAKLDNGYSSTPLNGAIVNLSNATLTSGLRAFNECAQYVRLHGWSQLSGANVSAFHAVRAMHLIDRAGLTEVRPYHTVRVLVVDSCANVRVVVDDDNHLDTLTVVKCRDFEAVRSRGDVPSLTVRHCPKWHGAPGAATAAPFGVAACSPPNAAAPEHVAYPASHGTCAQCMVRHSGVVLMPCRHLCLCEGCGRTRRTGGAVMECPVCHERITSRINVIVP